MSNLRNNTTVSILFTGICAFAVQGCNSVGSFANNFNKNSLNNPVNGATPTPSNPAPLGDPIINVPHATFSPTTTLTAETENNTSAADDFATLTVALPKHTPTVMVPITQSGDAAPGNVSKMSIHSFAPTGFGGKFFAHYMPWWGSSGHINIGYSSENAGQVANIVIDMISRGYDGVVIAQANTAGYDETAGLMLADVANSQGMLVMASENGLDAYAFTGNLTSGSEIITAASSLSHLSVGLGISGSGIPSGTPITPLTTYSTSPVTYSVTMSANATATNSDVTVSEATATSMLYSDMSYFNTHYFNLGNYYKVDGHPVVMVFDNNEGIDWNAASSGAAGQPLFIYRNQSALSNSNFYGGFSWFGGMTSGSALTGAESVTYLTSFYNAAAGDSGRFAAGDFWKGFNDTLATWTMDRIVEQQCGQSWLQSLEALSQYSKNLNGLPLVQVATWDDYEEGTEVETGIDNCASISASYSNSSLNFSLSFSSTDGTENTVDHYEVYASQDGRNLMLLKQLPAGSRSFSTSGLNLPSGSYQFFVKMVGKSHIINRMSNSVPVAFVSS
jgi:hypothetical protein